VQLWWVRTCANAVAVAVRRRAIPSLLDAGAKKPKRKTRPATVGPPHPQRCGYCTAAVPGDAAMAPPPSPAMRLLHRRHPRRCGCWRAAVPGGRSCSRPAAANSGGRGRPPSKVTHAAHGGGPPPINPQSPSRHDSSENSNSPGNAAPPALPSRRHAGSWPPRSADTLATARKPAAQR
jgi:hypothetical protein